MGGKYLLATLGCKVNQYESQQVRELLESHGLRPARAGEPAAIAIVNTCAVTAAASRKNRQAIRRLARGGQTPVVVIGCGATAAPSALRKLRGVCAVFGHDRDVLSGLRDLLAERLGIKLTHSAHAVPRDSRGGPNAGRNEQLMKPAVRGHERESTATRTTITNTIRALPVVKDAHTLTGRIEAFAGHQRAFLKVQDGCDAFCTYCIIPRLRPRPSSKPIPAVVAEARDLVRSGHKEIIVTGIFLGAFGRETAVRRRWLTPVGDVGAGQGGNLLQERASIEPRRRGPGNPLADLVAALAEVEGLVRVRLSSLEPGDVDDALLDVLASRKACVPHLHLPLQSGSPDILRRMNRQYGVDDYLSMVERVKDRLDRPAITTDIIVGFPGESDADFQASLNVAKAVGFCKVHAFPFSAREGTAAAKWAGEFVPPSTVRERMQRLAEVERECSLAFRSGLVGTTERVIVETPERGTAVEPEPNGSAKSRPPNTADPYGEVWPNVYHGRTDRYFDIYFAADEPRASTRAVFRGPGRGPDNGVHPSAGEVVYVRIDRVTPTRTHGTFIPAAGAFLSAS